MPCNSLNIIKFCVYFRDEETDTLFCALPKLPTPNIDFFFFYNDEEITKPVDRKREGVYFLLIPDLTKGPAISVQYSPCCHYLQQCCCCFLGDWKK